VIIEWISRDIFRDRIPTRKIESNDYFYENKISHI